EEEIVANLTVAAAGRTVLLMTHRLRAARAAARIVVLVEGRVVEQGPHEELMRASGVYASLCRLQQLHDEIASPCRGRRPRPCVRPAPRRQAVGVGSRPPSTGVRLIAALSHHRGLRARPALPAQGGHRRAYPARRLVRSDDDRWDLRRDPRRALRPED